MSEGEGVILVSTTYITHTLFSLQTRVPTVQVGATLYRRSHFVLDFNWPDWCEHFVIDELSHII